MNNFNTSTSGVNLELSIFFDTTLGEDLFNDSFVKAGKSDQYGGDNVWLYIDHGNILPLDLIHENYNFTKSDIINALTADHYIEDLNQVAKHYYGKPFSKLTKDELFSFVHEFLGSQAEAIDFYCKHLQPNFETIFIRGFCQGDYAEIIVPDQYWQVVGVEKPEDVQAYFNSTFTNLFYSAPLYAILTIDGEEFNFIEYINDWYEYDKDELLQAAKDHLTHAKKDYILAWLDDTLPDHPDYK